MIEYSYSLHALMRIKKREIKSEWIENTINSPDEIVYLEGTEVVCFLGIINDCNKKCLKVVVNIISKTIITIHFDRKWKRRIENENKNRQWRERSLY